MNVFKAKAPWIIDKLLKDFPIELDDAAAIVGNIGHESMGFTKLQEMKPTVAGSRGGYGWPQWTGPRRRAYEAYCERNKLDPASDGANYAYMFIELKDDYKNAIIKTKAAKDLYAKVVAFELQYEGAGIKHYPSRFKYAQDAIEAYHSNKIYQSLKPSVPTLEQSKDIDIPAPVASQGFWSRFKTALAERLK